MSFSRLFMAAGGASSTRATADVAKVEGHADHNQAKPSLVTSGCTRWIMKPEQDII
jgi:hypothetical protein